MIQNKQIEFKIFNAKTDQHKIKHKLREQELRAQQATPLSATQKLPYYNRQPRGSQHPSSHSTTTLRLHHEENHALTILVDTYGNDTHCLFKPSSLPTLTLATILKMANYNWHNRRLDDNPPSLKSVLTVLNFCGPPTNPVHYRNYIDMQTNIANSQGEEALGQNLEHSRSKITDSFIRGQQTTLQDFITLL